MKQNEKNKMNKMVNGKHRSCPKRGATPVNSVGVAGCGVLLPESKLRPKKGGHYMLYFLKAASKRGHHKGEHTPPESPQAVPHLALHWPQGLPTATSCPRESYWLTHNPNLPASVGWFCVRIKRPKQTQIK